MFEAPNVLILLIFVFGIYIAFRTFKRPSLPLPPGPKKLPLIGNLLDLPTKWEWLDYARWGKEFNSDILHLEAAGNDFIILNTFQAAYDLCEKRSALYSSRPQFPMINDLMGWDWLMSAMTYGEPWKERRRLFQQYFRGGNAHLYQPIARKSFRTMLSQLLDAPEDFMSIVRYTTGSVSISLAYGIPLEGKNDPYIELSEKAAGSISAAAVPGAFFVDIFPWLKYVPEWMPGAGFKRKAREWRKLQDDFRNKPFDKAVEVFAKGEGDSSLTTTSLAVIDESTDRLHQMGVIRDTAAIVFFGGSDTLLAGIYNFMRAMMLYPDIQRKAQDELDRVIGNRLPDFNDEPELPYITAIVKEILRWRPATPTAVAHYASEDDVYCGYHIPKGSIVIGNAWAMLHNEEDFPEPDTFRPERFIKDGNLDPTIRDPTTAAFGFGRRICPGKDVAMSMLWLSFATLLKTFDFSQPIDETGSIIPQELEYMPGLIFFPKPFKCTIKSRSQAAEELIRTATDC